MVDILLTILTFNLLIVFFKLFNRFRVDNLQALIINYFVAGTCSLYFSESTFSLSHILDSKWIIHAIAIGVFFIVTFNFFAIGTQKVGIALTTTANKLSLLIPVGVAILIYPNEHLTFWKIIGFLMAIIGIYFSTTQNKKLSFDKKYIGLILVIFIGQGIADSLFNNAQKTVVDDTEKGLFFMTILFVAGITGVFIQLIKSITQKSAIKMRSILGGLLFGVPNFFSILFFFNALENSGLPASQVYPIISMGVIILSAIVGILFFNEKLSVRNWIGLGFALMSIFTLTFYT